MTFKTFMLSIGIGLLVYSCPERHVAKHRLVLRFDSSFSSWVYNEVGLESNGQYFSPDLKSGAYDSLPEGEYHVFIHTVFGDLQVDTIRHYWNDTFFVRNRMDFPVKEKLFLNDLKEAAQIQIACTVIGCFCDMRNNLTLQKNQNGYLEFCHFDRTRNLEDMTIQTTSSIIDSIISVEDSLLTRDPNAGGCTTRESLYIKAGNKIFVYHNWDCDGRIERLFGKLTEN